jgi:hypothetical protein
MDIPTSNEVESDVHAIVVEARALRISTQDEFDVAGSFVRRIKDTQKRVDDIFDPAIEAAHKSHKAALAAKKKVREPLDQAERAIKSSISVFLAEEERKRRIEERRLAEAARAEEEERRLQEAIDLERAGHTEEADEVLAAPAAFTAPVVLPTPPKAAGISSRQVWKYRVISEFAIPRAFMTPDHARLAEYARAMGPSANVPGIEFYSETAVSVRGS